MTDISSLTSVCIYNLPDITDDEIRQIFSLGDQIEQIQRNRQQRICTITFKTHDFAKYFKDDFNYSKIQNEIISITWNTTDYQDPEANLVISNLPEDVGEKDLLNVLQDYGEVFSCRINRRRDGTSTGRCYVQFMDKRDAEIALMELTEAKIEDHEIIIEKYKRHEERETVKVQLPHTSIYIEAEDKSKLTEENLCEVFKKFGKVCDTVIEVENGKPEWAIITFDNLPNTRNAINAAPQLEKEGYVISSRAKKSIQLKLHKRNEARRIVVTDSRGMSVDEIRKALESIGEVVFFESNSYQKTFITCMYKTEELQKEAIRKLDRQHISGSVYPIRIFPFVEKSLYHPRQSFDQANGMLIINSLPVETTHHQLFDEYIQYGDILSVFICPTPSFELVGLVLFKEYQAAEKAASSGSRTNILVLPTTYLLHTKSQTYSYILQRGIPANTPNSQIVEPYSANINSIQFKIFKSSQSNTKAILSYTYSQDALKETVQELQRRNADFVLLSSDSFERCQQYFYSAEIPQELYKKLVFYNNLPRGTTSSQLFEDINKSSDIKASCVLCQYIFGDFKCLNKAIVVFQNALSATKVVTDHTHYLPNVEYGCPTKFKNKKTVDQSASTGISNNKLSNRELLIEKVKNSDAVNKEEAIKAVQNISLIDLRDYLIDENRFKEFLSKF